MNYIYKFISTHFHFNATHVTHTYHTLGHNTWYIKNKVSFLLNILYCLILINICWFCFVVFAFHSLPWTKWLSFWCVYWNVQAHPLTTRPIFCVKYVRLQIYRNKKKMVKKIIQNHFHKTVIELYLEHATNLIRLDV